MTAGECRSYLKHLERFGIKLGLDNIRALLAAFGDPHRAYPCVHVAGTNGKGSVCAMIAEALERNGLKAGLYTSPHLVRVEERIRVAGKLIPAAEFRRITGEVKARSEKLLASGALEAPPTFFEVLTAIAMLYFREKKIDIAIFEVGMGGRFDATNVVTPLVSVITNIALDHQEYLGKTIGAIAFEKAGIIKPGVPVVTGTESETALKVIRARAKDEGAFLIRVRDGKTKGAGAKAGLSRKCPFEYRFGYDIFQFAPGLPGAHQGKNATVALAALSVLHRIWRPLDKSKMVDGIENTRWEGRLELVGTRPRFYLDGAHNAAGAEVLKAFIRNDLRVRPVLVFAMMKDKAVGRAVRLLFPQAKKIILTSIPYARAARPEGILSLAGPFRKKIVIEPSLERALALARREAGPRGIVLAAGSLYLVGAIKKLLN
jgi:dihydrofolate synthase/folylpolyglutamate synthase